MEVHDTGTPSKRDVLLRWIEIQNNAEYERFAEVLDPEYVGEMPQSGERIEGIEGAREFQRKLPGGRTAGELVQAEETGPRYVMTPTFNVVKVEETADSLFAIGRLRFPDGSDWFIASWTTYRNHKILKEISLLGQPMESPPWRAGVSDE